MAGSLAAPSTAEGQDSGTAAARVAGVQPATGDGLAEGERVRRARVVIVGAGFSGLGMAIVLTRAGIDDFVVLEQAEEGGGTWRDNTYPGCACDVQSNLYSFSSAPTPDWTRLYSPQPEIWAYLRRCIEQFGIGGHICWGHEMRDDV